MKKGGKVDIVKNVFQNLDVYMEDVMIQLLVVFVTSGGRDLIVIRQYALMGVRLLMDPVIGLFHFLTSL